MRFTDVLTATDMNPNYYKFIPIFIETWKQIFPGIRVHIILISEIITDELQQFKDYIKLFKPLNGMSTAFIAQNIRTLYPALLTDAKGGILITDMDMIPMGKKYYTETIQHFDTTKFICYRPLNCVGKNEMVICYNIAHYDVWADVFQIQNLDDITNTLHTLYKENPYEDVHGGIGWCTDQLYLFSRTQEWNKQTRNLLILDHNIYDIYHDNISLKKYHRVFKYYNINLLKALLEKDILVDFHIPKTIYPHQIKPILDLIKETYVN